MSYDKGATLHSVWSFKNKIKHPFGLLNSNLNYRYFNLRSFDTMNVWTCLILFTSV
jgi:hypothetical protein